MLRQGVTVGVLAAVMAGQGVAPTTQDEGQAASVKRWVEELENETLRDRAADALARAGRRALPSLLSVLADGKRQQATRVRVVQILARMGPEAAEAVPKLQQLIESAAPAESVALWQTLAELALYAEVDLKLIDRPLPAEASPEQPKAAVDAMIRARSRSTVRSDKSIEELLTHLRGGDGYVREAAAELLAQRGERSSKVSEALEDLLVAAQPPARITKRLILSKDGRIVQWESTTQSVEPSIRLRAALALLAIDPMYQAPAAAHAYRLRHGRPRERLDSAVALGRMGALEAVPDLLVAARDVDSRVACEAITALGMIGPGAGRAIPTLEQLAEHEDKQLSETAKVALRQIWQK